MSSIETASVSASKFSDLSNADAWELLRDLITPRQELVIPTTV